MSDADLACAARHAPWLHFDAREPFLPSAVGYTLFRADGPSPSFPRQVTLAAEGRPTATLAIEYAVWWEWDIQHLYELEHLWVYLDGTGSVVWVEASWHGSVRPMRTAGGGLPVVDGRPHLWPEPGKHAFAPEPAWHTARRQETMWSCGPGAGRGGVWVTPLFEGLIQAKTPHADRLVHTWLAQRAFVPSFDFSQTVAIDAGLLLPWPALQATIPARVATAVAELAAAIPPTAMRVLRIAHRGASELAPENTLAAFELARQQGADMIELDVHLSADGVPIVIHSATLDETTTGLGPVAAQPLALLQTLDAGRGERIPTLAAVLEWAEAHQMGLYIELKAPGTAAAVAALVAAREMQRHVIVGSFNAAFIAAARRHDPRLTTSILFGQRDGDPVALARGCGASYVHPCWERLDPEPHTLLTPSWLDAVRAAGLGVITWHEERPAELAALLRLGVEGICTNRPDRLTALAGQWAPT